MELTLDSTQDGQARGEPHDASSQGEPSHLLPWERLELGGRYRRLGRTLGLAWFCPIRYCRMLGQRRNRPIARRTGIIFGCVAVSLGVHSGLVVSQHVLSYEAIRFDSVWENLSHVFRPDRWISPIGQLVPAMLATVVVSVRLVRWFPKQLDAFGFRDVFTALCPAVAVGAYVWLVGIVVALGASMRPMLAVVITVTVLCQPLIHMLYVWPFCLHVLKLNRRRALGTAIWCGVLTIPVYWLVWFWCLTQAME